MLYFPNDFKIISFIFLGFWIYSILKKNWKHLFSVLFYYFVFLVIWVFLSFGAALKPENLVGNREFYVSEIFKSSGIEIPEELILVAKLDPIVLIGVESEYNAECIFEGSSKIIKELERKIKKNKNFIKVDKLDNYPTELINPDNFSVKNIKSIYKGKLLDDVIYISFDKSNKKFYYLAMYF